MPGLKALALAGLGIGLAAREMARRSNAIDLDGQVALITGGSRGLGLAMAHEMASKGARLVICGRDPGSLEAARTQLADRGAQVLAFPCDVSRRDEVQAMVGQATAALGRIDVLINNAGVIMVGPLEHQTLPDYEEAMGVMFWGVVYPTLAVLPQMIERRGGRIVNITSIGGKVAVPHLMPYNCAKFAAVGFSESLTAEVARHGIGVTTVVPWLMRTGSHLNAEFKGQNEAEFALFSPLSTLPVLSVDATKAARRVIRALERGDPEVMIGLQAELAARLHALVPGLSVDLMGVIGRFLPGPGGIGTERRRGHQSRSPMSDTPLTALGEEAAHRLNQYRSRE